MNTNSLSFLGRAGGIQALRDVLLFVSILFENEDFKYAFSLKKVLWSCETI